MKSQGALVAALVVKIVAVAVAVVALVVVFVVLVIIFGVSGHMIILKNFIKMFKNIKSVMTILFHFFLF